MYDWIKVPIKFKKNVYAYFSAEAPLARKYFFIK